MKQVIIGAAADVHGHGHGIILIRSDKDKDKEQSDKKTIGVCRSIRTAFTIFSEISEVGNKRGMYADMNTESSRNLLMEVMSISDK